MRAAREDVSRFITAGLTPEQLAQARANLDALNQPRQPALPLVVKR